MSTTENAVPQGIEIADVTTGIQDLGVPTALSGTLQRVQDDTGVASAMYLSTAKLQVGSADQRASFQAMVPLSDANGAGCIIGDSNVNLRLGVNANYAWIQSHGSKPLELNPIGNTVAIGSAGNINVGIGTSSPQARLDVNGSVRAGSLTVAGALNVGSLTIAGQGLKITAVPSATTAPGGGSTLKVLFVDPATGSLYAL
jgi:hypothetical protein